MTDLTSLTIAAARDGLRKKQFSALELTDAYLAAMEKARVLNAYVVETPEKARDMPEAMTTERSAESPIMVTAWSIEPIFCVAP